MLFLSLCRSLSLFFFFPLCPLSLDFFFEKKKYKALIFFFRIKMTSIPLFNRQVSTHFCSGVVLQPAKGLLQGTPVWSCQLLISQCGMSALPGTEKVWSQQKLTLKCRGTHFAKYCSDHISHGDVVHVVSKLIHHQKYVPTHETYFGETQLLVTDSYGSITLIDNLKRN